MTDSAQSMTTPPTPPPSHIDPVTGLPVQAQPLVPEERKLVAPIWHTIMIVLVILANSVVSFLFASRMSAADTSAITDKQRIGQYVFTIGFELVLLFLVWIGLRLRRVRLTDLIGRWKTPEAFLIDVGIAAAYWVVAIAVLAGMGWLLGLAKGSQLQESKKLAEALAPRSLTALGIFVLLSTVAGVVEEILFRGYLQRQFAAITGSAYAAIALQAVVFGAGHGYEGVRRMVLIFVYGLMFGLLARWRRSLLPGMMAHAWHDSFEGALLFFVARKGFPTMPP